MKHFACLYLHFTLSPRDKGKNIVHRRGPKTTEQDLTSPGRKPDYTDTAQQDKMADITTKWLTAGQNG
jgi:hypothetical protein